jgi:hypothetical protein
MLVLAYALERHDSDLQRYNINIRKALRQTARQDLPNQTMIENATLHLQPWRWGEPGNPPGLALAGWVRRVHSGEGVEAGFVRATRLGRWPGLTPQQLDVLETEDASLVMTLRRGWLSLGRWQVIDAEGRVVALLQAPHVLDGWGQRYARIEAVGSGRWLVRRDRGEVCATIVDEPDGVQQLGFAPAMEENPYLRMAILGAALALRPRPTA